MGKTGAPEGPAASRSISADLQNARLPCRRLGGVAVVRRPGGRTDAARTLLGTRNRCAASIYHTNSSPRITQTPIVPQPMVRNESFNGYLLVSVFRMRLEEDHVYWPLNEDF